MSAPTMAFGEFEYTAEIGWSVTLGGQRDDCVHVRYRERGTQHWRKLTLVPTAGQSFGFVVGIIGPAIVEAAAGRIAA